MEKKRYNHLVTITAFWAGLLVVIHLVTLYGLWDFWNGVEKIAKPVWLVVVVPDVVLAILAMRAADGWQVKKWGRIMAGLNVFVILTTSIVFLLVYFG